MSTASPVVTTSHPHDITKVEIDLMLQVYLPVNKQWWILWPGLSPAMWRSRGMCGPCLIMSHNSLSITGLGPTHTHVGDKLWVCWEMCCFSKRLSMSERGWCGRSARPCLTMLWPRKLTLPGVITSRDKKLQWFWGSEMRSLCIYVLTRLKWDLAPVAHCCTIVCQTH